MIKVTFHINGRGCIQLMVPDQLAFWKKNEVRSLNIKKLKMLGEKRDIYDFEMEKGFLSNTLNSKAVKQKVTRLYKNVKYLWKIISEKVKEK